MKHYAILGAAGLLLTLHASPLNGHITVSPRVAPAQSYQVFTVRVPTERDVPTLTIRLAFPAGFRVLSFQPKPGWTYELERDADGNVTGVIWTGGRIGRNEFEQFRFVARTPEDPGTILIDAFQSYEGGETVAWVNPEEPNPAPAIRITAAVEADEAPADPFATAGTSTAAQAPGGGSSTLLSGSALVLAAAALVISLKSARQR